MRRLVSTAFFLTLSAVFFAADIHERLGSILPSAVATELLSATSLQHSAYRETGAVLKLAPAVPLAREIGMALPGTETPFFIESLYLYKKKAGHSVEAGKDTTFISVILRSLSHLQGVEYYSTSRKKMRILYEKSYVIDSPSTRSRLPDPVSASADRLSVFVLQKDMTFGEYVYRYSYRQDADSVSFTSTNVDTLNYSFLKLIEPGNLRVSLVVTDLGDYILVYGLTSAVFPELPGLGGKINSSFSTRADAVYKWFIEEYEHR
jgi:hypothetical protein